MSDNITYNNSTPLTPTVHSYTSLHRVYFCQNHSLPRVLCSIPTRIFFIFQSFHPQETPRRGLCTTCRNSSEGKWCDVCAPPLMPKLNISTQQTTLWDEMSKNPPTYTFRSGRGFLPSLSKFLILNEMPSAQLWLPLKTQTFWLPAICIPKTGSITVGHVRDPFVSLKLVSGRMAFMAVQSGQLVFGW